MFNGSHVLSGLGTGRSGQEGSSPISTFPVTATAGKCVTGIAGASSKLRFTGVAPLLAGAISLLTMFPVTAHSTSW